MKIKSLFATLYLFSALSLSAVSPQNWSTTSSDEFLSGDSTARTKVGGREVESMSLDQRDAQMELTPQAVEAAAGLNPSCQSNADRFDGEAVVLTVRPGGAGFGWVALWPLGCMAANSVFVKSFMACRIVDASTCSPM